MIEDGTRLRVYVDADTLLAGSVAAGNGRNGFGSPSLVCIVLSEMGLVDLRTTDFAVEEARRNLGKLDPGEVEPAREELKEVTERALTVCETPDPEVWGKYSDYADDKDLPHLASAIEIDCRALVSINTSDYRPPEECRTVVMPPGEFVVRARLRIREIDTMAAKGIWFEV